MRTGKHAGAVGERELRKCLAHSKTIAAPGQRKVSYSREGSASRQSPDLARTRCTPLARELGKLTVGQTRPDIDRIATGT